MVTIIDNKHRSYRIIKEKIKGLRIIDNAMFQICAKNNPVFVEHILRPIVKTVFNKDDDIHITRLTIEDVQPNAAGRGIRIDALAVDSEDRYFIVEIQRVSDLRDLVYRVRFYRAAVDTTLLKDGQQFRDIPEVHVVFICEHDPRNLGRSYYQSKEVWVDDGTPVNDGVSSIYINGDYRGYDLIGELNHDLMCTNPDEMFDDTLANTVRRFKLGGEDEYVMLQHMDFLFEKEIRALEPEFRSKFKAEGRAEGRAEGEIGMLQKLINAGILGESDLKKFCKSQGNEELLSKVQFS